VRQKYGNLCSIEFKNDEVAAFINGTNSLKIFTRTCGESKEECLIDAIMGIIDSNGTIVSGANDLSNKV
jgi:hypothetical protein